MRMTIERTLSIIKPDATRRNITGAINDRLERGGLRIIAHFAESIEANSVHGSDSPENAEEEIAFFFSTIEICP